MAKLDTSKGQTQKKKLDARRKKRLENRFGTKQAKKDVKKWKKELSRK